MQLRDALDEIDQYKNIDMIDDEYKYHLKIIKVCNNFDLQSIEQDCEVINSEKQNNNDESMIDIKNQYVSLEIEDGGQSLDDFLKKIKTNEKKITIDIYFNLIKGMQNIVNGINLMANNNFQHLDLKTMNLVIDDKFEVKFIDFGLSSTFDNIDSRNFLFTSSYSVYPMDIILLGEEYYKEITDEKKNNIKTLKLL